MEKTHLYSEVNHFISTTPNTAAAALIRKKVDTDVMVTPSAKPTVSPTIKIDVKPTIPNTGVSGPAIKPDPSLSLSKPVTANSPIILAPNVPGGIVTSNPQPVYEASVPKPKIVPDIVIKDWGDPLGAQSIPGNTIPAKVVITTDPVTGVKSGVLETAPGGVMLKDGTQIYPGQSSKPIDGPAVYQSDVVVPELIDTVGGIQDKLASMNLPSIWIMGLMALAVGVMIYLGHKKGAK